MKSCCRCGRCNYRKGVIMIIPMIITTILFSLCIIGEIYEIRNEDDEDKKKKLWLFSHDLY